MTRDWVLTDDPAPDVRRITLNRPEKRNALNHQLRGALMDALRADDQDPDVRVMIVRGAGTCFSAGYDLGGGNEGDLPGFTAGRRRPVAPPRHRALDEHLGPRQARHRPGPRLLPGRRQRAGHRL